MFYIILLLFVAFLFYFHFSTRYSRAGRLINKIPGPYPLPIIGNGLWFNDYSQRGMWICVRKFSDLHYPISKGWVLHQAMISIRHPDDIEILLSSQKASHKDFPYKFLRPWLNDGLLTNRGNTYRVRRKMLTPAFHFNMLSRYVDIINKHAERLVRELSNRGNEFTLDVLSIYADVSFNIIIEAAMGVEINDSNKETVKNYKHAVEEMGSVLIYRMMRPYIPDWVINSLLPIGRKQNHALKILREFTDKIVRERRERHKKSGELEGFKEFTDNMEKQEADSIYSVGYKKKLPMLDILLSAQRSGLIDDQGIREEVDTFLLGGTDTTGMTMAYFTMLMAENKDIQDRARAEICNVFEASNGKTEIPHLQQMPYLEQCIKETMRMFPIGATVFRYTTGDIQLKNYVIPPNVLAVVHIYDAHRDPNFWPEPTKFDPDRFLLENCRNRHPFAFVPFSAGPRNCIGQKFGMLELKSVCARLLYNFYLEPVDRISDITLIGDIVLRPDKPFCTRYIKINRE